MGGFNFRSILFGTILILMLISIFFMGLTMYKISNAKKYELQSGQNAGDAKTVKVEGVSASRFWETEKMSFIAPSVCNVFGMALIGLLYMVV